MSDNIALNLNSISKIYKLYDSKHDFLKELIHLGYKSYHKKFFALKDITFSVKKGEVIGIIGRNGSGKSTLLKILASIVTPTSGKYIYSGKIAALIELSGGFNRELTGIQNIEFLGELLGFTKKEIRKKTKTIIEFAEIGEFAGQPIKSYSSGMYMRLAFSLAIHVNPDILIVDEILGVGDLQFQQKCFQRINEFKEAGKTIVLCSHDLQTVQNFCTRALWINQGVLMADDNPAEVVNRYSAYKYPANN